MRKPRYWIKAIRARWDLAGRLAAAQRSVKSMEHSIASRLRTEDDLRAKLAFVQTQRIDQEDYMRSMLESADVIFTEAPKGPISMHDVLRWRADYRVFWQSHSPAGEHVLEKIRCY